VFISSFAFVLRIQFCQSLNGANITKNMLYMYVYEYKDKKNFAILFLICTFVYAIFFRAQIRRCSILRLATPARYADCAADH
jgi:hypothetical protein